MWGINFEHRQEILFPQNGHPARSDGANGGVSQFVVDQGHLSEVLPGGEPGNHFLGSIFLAGYCELTAVDEISAIAFVAFSENHLSRLDIFDLKQTVAPQESIHYDAKDSRDGEHHE